MATGIDTSGLYAGRREAVGIIKAMAQQVTSFDVFSGIGVSAATAFAKAAKSAYDFERELQGNMLEVATISTQVEGSMTDFMNRVMEITQKIPIKAPEAAKALYQIVSAGHDGADGMRILEVAARSAIGGMTDTATAADAITSLINSYKLGAADAERVSDQLFTTARLGKTTFGELGNSIAQVAPIAASYGVEMEQVLAAVATLTKSGTPTAQAMTQIRASIVGASKVLGDGAFEGRTFQEALAQVADMAEGSESRLRELIPEVEAVNGVLGLTGPKARDAAEHLKAMSESAGATESAFRLMLKDVDKQMDLLANHIQAALRPMGMAILKEVSGVAAAFNEAFDNGDVERAVRSLGDLVVIITGAFVGYKGAVVASTLAQRVSMAVAREAVLIRRLEKVALLANVAGHKALTAAQLKEMAAKRMLTKSIKAHTAALLRNAAAMLTNPYVLAAAAVAALGYGLYKYATRATAAEKATAAHNKRVKELHDWADRTRDEVDGMVASLRDENVRITEKIKLYERLKGIYPDELRNISLQNFLLMDSVKANNLLAKALDERVKAQQRATVNAIEAEMKSNDARITELEGKEGMDMSFGEWFELRRLRSRNEQLKIEFEKAKEIVIQGLKEETKARFAAESLNTDNEKGETILQRKIALTGQLAEAEAKLRKLRAPDSTASESEIKEAENGVKELRERLATLTGEAVKEGDSLRRKQEEMARSAIDSELRLQAERVALMEEGKARRVALAEQECRETVAAIRREREEMTREARAAGVKADTSALDERERLAVAKRDKAVAGIDREYAEEYKRRTRELASVFVGEERRKIDAIKERYDSERRWADEQLRTGGMSREEHGAYTATVERARIKENYDTLLSGIDDYKSREKALREKWDTDINAAVEAKDAYLVSRLMEGKEKALSALNSQMLQESSEWLRLFGNLDTLTTEEIGRLIESIQRQMDSGTLTLSPVDARALMASLNEAREKVAASNPFKALGSGAKEMSRALAELRQAEADGLTGESLDVYRRKVKDAAANVRKAVNAIGDTYGKVSEVMRSAAGFVGMVDEGLGQTVDNAVSLGEAVMNVGSVVAQAVISFAAGMNTMESASVILLVIKAVLMAVMAAISLFNGDKRHEKKIKALGDRVKDLERAYDRLGRAIENTYSDKVFSLMGQQEDNLRRQQALIREQMREERKKKKGGDKDKLREYENKIEEINGKIEESRRKQVEMLAGTDVRTAIDDLADALVEAYARGEDAAEALGKTTREVLAGAVREALKRRFLGDALQEAVNRLGEDMRDGELSAADRRRFEETVKKAGEGFGEAMSAYGDLFKDMEEGMGATTDSLADAIMAGLRAGKTGIRDFAGSFEDSVRTALMEGLRTRYLEGPLKELRRRFADLSGTDGRLTAAEIGELREMYARIVEGAREQFDSIRELSGIDLADGGDNNTLKGAYAKASQESIDLLAGQTGAVRVLLEDIRAETRPVREQMRLIHDLQSRGWEDVRAIRKLSEKVERNTAGMAESAREIREAAGKISEHTKGTVDALEGTINVKVKM